MIHISPSTLDQITEVFNRRKQAIGLSEYSLGELFDHGGMSNIYRVVDAQGNTEFVLRVSEERKSSYSNDIYNVREMDILRELKKNSQPHVLQYLDAFVVDIPEEPRYYCAVMKFLCSLKQYRIGGDGVEIAVRLGCDFLPLLQSFVDKKILHRDIKPENIFFDGDFRNETGFLMGDFGIAKRNTQTSVTPTGTESTMAPEVRGLDRSLGRDRMLGDMYSLGMVMYKYLNQGVYPSNSERIEKIPPDKEPFPEPRNGSKRLKRLVVKATSYYPRDRFESPQAMLRELQKCEEYGRYIMQNEEPVEDDESVKAEIERLRRELNEKEKKREAVIAEQQEQIDRLRKQAVKREKKVVTQTIKRSPSTVAGRRTGAQNGGLLRSKSRVAIAAIVIISVLTVGIWAVIAFSGGSSVASSKVVSDIQGEESSDTVSSAAPKEVKPLSALKSVSVGNHFSFGNYKQGANAEIQPIEWRVLDVREGKALVISERLLEYVPYHETDANVTWKTCTLRKWMNGEFLKEAFTADEQKKIAAVTKENPNNPDYGTKGGAATKDRIFALNIDEAWKYFSSDEDRIGYTTEYVHAQGFDSSDRAEYWWLCSPGHLGNFAADVVNYGNVTRLGNVVNSKGVAVRPAFWLKLK